MLSVSFLTVNILLQSKPWPGPSGPVFTKYLWWTLYYLSHPLPRHVSNLTTHNQNENFYFTENIPARSPWVASSQESADVNEVDILYCTE